MSNKRYWLRGGIILSIIGIIIMTDIAMNEYRGCSPAWDSMCGTGIGMLGMLFGFGTPFITFSILGPLIGPIANKDLSYIIGSLVFVLNVAVLYFFIGSFLGWIFGKVVNRKNQN